MSALLFSIVDALILMLEAIGVAVMVGGFITATIVYLVRTRHWATHRAYIDYRRRSVRGLILGLEFLVAADIIKTVAVDYTMQSLLMLGIIILIRTFLVFALHLEIEGRFPWSEAAETDDEARPR